MHTQNASRSWYQKKRYVLPLAAILLAGAGFVLVGDLARPAYAATTRANISKSKAKPKPQPVKKKQVCNPNYSGCLLPNASDYDCAGGSGNGPYYTGKVRVLGYDQYGLDRDGDGWGCE